MLIRQRLASFYKGSFFAFPFLKLRYRLNEASNIFRAAEEVGCFFKSLVIVHRDHHYRTFPFPGYRHRGMVVTYLIHGFGKVASG